MMKNIIQSSYEGMRDNCLEKEKKNDYSCINIDIKKISINKSKNFSLPPSKAKTHASLYRNMIK